jgi:catechol 2,3-dioxygenase-like lactoylglutathione lyase family enzyme
MKPFNINFLDHVAIRVKDLNVSIVWYSKVLGLKKYQLEKWGEFPVFMLSGKSGIALFPANLDHEKLNLSSRNVKIDHFAFNVSNEDFEKAQNHFKSLGEPFQFQDHHYFHSIYLKDPDNHTVELTTLLVDEADFYK